MQRYSPSTTWRMTSLPSFESRHDCEREMVLKLSVSSALSLLSWQYNDSGR